MKCVFIVYNQANTERVEYMLDELGIRGFTFFEQVQGRGSRVRKLDNRNREVGVRAFVWNIERTV